jgi:amino acid adenylation domain-containing protein
MDPQHRVFLENCLEALENAGCDPARYKGSIGVYAGCYMDTYILANLCSDPGFLRRLVQSIQIGSLQTELGNDKDYLATRVAFKLNLRGPALTVQSACSTSLVAINHACQALQTYQCDMALGGAATITFPQKRGHYYKQGGMLSPDGHCRPFDENAQGTVFSNASAVVVLKRLEDALADHDTIYATILGHACNNDGAQKLSYTAPSVEGQAEVIALAQTIAGIDPRSIGYIEAHGTATPLGDPIEIQGLTNAFRMATQDKGFCAIGSVKSNIGHADCASGVIGMIKTVMCLHHKTLVPTLHFTRPNPKIDFENSPFYVNTAVREFPDYEGIRRAGVSSFGVGGTNAHLVLEEAPLRAASRERVRARQLLLLSAKTPSALDAMAARLSAHLAVNPSLELCDVAYTLQIGRTRHSHRRFVVVDKRDDAIEKLSEPGLAQELSSTDSQDPPVVFMFPGQGAQFPGMARALYDNEPVFADVFNECADLAAPMLGMDLREVVFRWTDEGAAAERLRQTAITQPAIFSVEYALAKLWMSWGLVPNALVGHSVGELAAATIANVLALPDALRIVTARGRLMQELPSGSMLSIRASADRAAKLMGDQLAIAAVNAPELVVASGPDSQIAMLESRLALEGIQYSRLHTSHAFHSAMMDTAVGPMVHEVAKSTLRAPTVPMMSTVTGTWLTATEVCDPVYWGQNLRRTVRFADAIAALRADDERRLFLEVGPGQTLTTLAIQTVGRTSQALAIPSLSHARQGDAEVQALMGAVGRLWLQGVQLDWSTFHGENRWRVPLPTYPFERKKFWVEPAAVDASTSAMARVGDEDQAESGPETDSDSRPPHTRTSSDDVELNVANRVRALLSQCSGIPLGDIDATRSFIELGFDSLLLGQVSAAIEKAFLVHVSFRQLTDEYSNLDRLARHLELKLAERESAKQTDAGTEPSEPDAKKGPTTPDEALAGNEASAALGVGEQSTASPQQTSAPMSEAQLELWAAVEMGREASCSYNLCFSLALNGKIFVDDLKASVQRVFDRHEALRTKFDASAGVQYFPPPHDVDIAVVDLRACSEKERTDRIQAIFDEEVQKPFDLVNGPCARAQILIESPTVVQVVLTAHHIVCDGWTGWLFFRDLAEIYTAAREGRAVALSAPVPFRRHLEREASPKGRQLAAVSSRYWRGQYVDGAPWLELPTDFTRPPLRSYRGARVDHRLTSVSGADISRTAARLGSTSVGLLLSVFQVLLFRLTGQTEVVVGVPLSSRDPADRDGLAGHATNLLPMLGSIDPESSFSDFVRSTRRALVDAQEHPALTFGTLIQKLKLPRDSSRNALVSAVFNVDRARIGHKWPEAKAELRVLPRQFVNFELELQIADLREELVLELAYNRDLFTAETIRRWLRHFEQLLAAAVANPDTSLRRLPMLADQDRTTLEGWNATKADFPKDVSVAGLVEEQAARTPQRTAVRLGETSLSYAELDARANQWAHALRRRGVRRGSRVGICLERSIDLVPAVLAVLKAGAGYVPLDPVFPAERLAYMQADSGLSVVISQSQLRDLHRTPVEQTMELDTARAELDAESREPLQDEDAVVKEGDVAYVLYTSGSTGKPKGVLVSHGAVVNFLTSMLREPGLTQDDRLLAVTTLSFDIAVLELLLPLCTGAEVVVATRPQAMDGSVLRGLLDSEQVTVMQATPATWRLLIESGWQGRKGFKALCGGEPLAPDLAESLLERVGELWNMYGPTETTVWSTCCRIESPHSGIGIGRPIANTTVWILDEAGEPCPIGVPGEIHIGGAGVALGYLNRPELNADRFIEDRFAGNAGARLYRTGDLGLWTAQGQLKYLGRKDLQVKVRGFRVEPGEIEVSLVTYPGVKQAIVVTREDHPGDVRLVAYLIAGDGGTPESSGLRKHLSASLPDYMIPQHFVFLRAFPSTPNGKLDRSKLPRPMDSVEAKISLASTARSPMEELVQRVWAEHLGYGDFSPQGNFFDIGGSSLIAARIAVALEKALGRSVGLTVLFQHPTVERLAQALSGAEKDTGGAPSDPVAERARKQRQALGRRDKPRPT